MSLKEVVIPPGGKYASDRRNTPLEFYLNAVPRSRTIDLKLGYFSSSAIHTLAVGFAPFIYHGGRLRLITNHFLYPGDQQLVGLKDDPGDLETEFRKDISWLYETFANPQLKHFMNCLRYLSQAGQLEVIPVRLKPGRMVHFKEAVLTDRFDNSISVEGSGNFTSSGLVGNAESLRVFRSWGSESEASAVELARRDFAPIFDRQSEQYEYLSNQQLEDAIHELGEDKTLEQLMRDEQNLLSESGLSESSELLESHIEMLEHFVSTNATRPRFPFPDGPHPYQLDALRNWKACNKRGIFAMATGTGKTITSLNCLLEEFAESGSYQALVLVPSELLVNQWEEEARRFHFHNIYLVSSKNRIWRRDIRSLSSEVILNPQKSFVVIATYASFAQNVALLSERLPESMMLIADEAHNVGAPKMRATLRKIRQHKRLGLSATPKRDFDVAGNEAIEKFFDSSDPYTYSFSMERAISEGFLCKYYYFPVPVYLDEDEMEEYRVLSTKLSKLFHGDADNFNNNEIVKRLLLARKRIIHKASSKLLAFKRILGEELKSNPDLNFTFVYVPEGVDGFDNPFIEKFISASNDVKPSLRV
ncbi:MAG: DEAD/DEAH box helicase family protein, partial [Betaproteobacteria bacterium]